METVTKKWWASATLWGVIVSVGGKAAAMILGTEIDEQTLNGVTTEVVHIVDQSAALWSVLASFIGDAIAFYGRVKAKKAIS